MAVRSAMPWPFRWAILAIVMGFCAAIGLWAFEFGKDIAGIEHGTKEELLRLRAELVSLHAELDKVKDERDKAQTIANTAGTLLTTEKASQERMIAQVHQLEQENRTLRDDLGFFEKLIPTSTTSGVSIRSVQAEVLGARALKWQVLMIQASKNAQEFSGRLELTFAGTQGGKPWSANLPEGALAVQLRQYGRLEGNFEIPAQVTVKSVSARLLDGATVKSTQTVKL